MKIFLTILVLFAALLTHAQEGEVMKGNRYYKEGNYDKAEEAYQKALSKKENLIARYNLGNTLYKKESIDDAVKSFDGVISATDDPELKTKALYNKGVLLHKGNRLTEAIDAYKQALRLNPDDEEVRKNLQLALQQKKQQEPKQEQKKEQKEQKQKQEKKKEEPKPQQPKPQKSKLTKKQAEQYLKALEQKERELQEKVRKKTAVPNQPEKDW
ncbi:tetratricopeptide repeat protein [Lacibacter sediminis]|uniref:Tetratricopeptide repeat protein n=1 Tax=Lacibacter sediminis TaxID=2760713 RepID=A0A7G5XEI7_9BACT|nr:tetratricopeptide repeat protein [Lacibacter sediminis]QNA43890.1 tetratricopeptide repeat protein [Lacibacter sediminis]